MDMVMERTYVEDIAMSIQSIFAPIATQKGIDFKVDVAPGTPEVIQTDKFRLEQVLKNFLSNAFKFTPAQGSVQLLIGRGPDPQTFTLSKLLQRSAGIISFAVKDTGIGIAADKQADIFVAFRQADGSTSRKYGGTGLGLSISRQLAGLLGGEIRLESEPGKGSTFALFVPAGFTV
jgi:signal transduction histidine kinase